MPKIVVSYHRSESVAIAGRICDRLVARYGNDSVLMDLEDIETLPDLRAHIRNLLNESDVLLAVVGPQWLHAGHDRQKQNDPVQIEIETALEQSMGIIPVLLDGSRVPPEAELPESIKRIASFKPAALSSGRDFHLHMERLIRSIEQVLKDKPAPAAD